MLILGPYFLCIVAPPIGGKVDCVLAPGLLWSSAALPFSTSAARDADRW